MKLLYDFFPIILFFIAYKMYGIFTATAVAIVAAFFQVGFYWLKNRKFEKMHLISLAMITVLGGLTLLLQDNRFIMWKPTIVNWIFATVLLGSQFIGKKNLMQRMLGQQIELPDPVWLRLNISWVCFFLLSGTLNIYVAFNYSEATWVNFRLFGLLGLTIIFIIGQAIYLSTHMMNKNSDNVTESE